MVAHLLRLRFALLVNGFRRSVWQTIGFAVGAVYVLFVVVLAVGGVAALGLGSPDLAPDAVVTGGAVLVLGWWVLPLLFFGQDATLDPQHFSLFGIPARRLTAGLALAALVGIGGVALVLVSLGWSLAWLASPALVPVALVGGVAGVAVAVLGSRALTSTLAPFLEARRAREVTSIAVLVLGVLGWLAFVGTTGSGGSFDSRDLGPVIERVATVAAWTPVGAPWALAGDVSDGAWAALLARVAIVAATVAAAWWAWTRALARAMVTTSRPTASGSQQGLGWFARFPATPTGAVAARTATYWLRDPRYAGSLAVVPFMPVVLVVVAGGDLSSPLLLVAAPLVAMLFGFSLSNDVAYDHTAFALHVSTAVRGVSDRLGRVVPALAVSIPLVVAFALASAGLTGRWDLLPPVLGLSLGTLGVSLGVSAVVSVLYLYPVPKPGRAPSSNPPARP
ncbi:hypothetical protein GCM10025865_02600 [Paraoerskovia sediminicola]|uniref:ABC-2 type transport system permease protein n=1 Tax=Paraoerskovia sediminicola TaxID=1138587 RepID=A0ABM8FYX8_9CELL|nr:hypothetical protein [Paraoerskovia sediminicola]BDZ40961.1 hypothetical protein GCM10025865_02600 [Paraoerskovia sediminicola]